MKVRWIVAVGLLALLGVASPFAVRFAQTEVDDVSSRPVAVVHATAAVGGGGDRGLSVAEREVAASAQAGRGVSVTVIDANGDPVAGATVRHEVRSRDDEKPAVTLGEAVTDARGLAEAALEQRAPNEHDVITARSGELYGEARVDADDDRVVIELQRDLTLEIEVVDALGRPRAGIEVGVEAEIVSRRLGRGGSSLWARPTDAEGRVRMEHVQVGLVPSNVIAGTLRVFCERRVDPSTTTSVAEQSLDLARTTGTARVRLVLPVGGSITVRITDAAGEPSDFALQLRGEGGEPWAAETVERDGRQWFVDVPVNRRWTVVASSHCGANIAEPIETSVAVNGPTSADDVVEVAIQLPAQWWAFRAKASRKDGVALSGLSGRWRCSELSIDAASAPYSDGTLEVRGWFPASVTRVTSVELRLDVGNAQPRTLRFAGPLSPGAHDFGEIQLDPPVGERLLASVEVRCDGKAISDRSFAQLIANGAQLQERSRRVDGRIELYGVPPPGPMFLLCGNSDCLRTDSVPIAIGEHRVVELQRAASLLVPVVPPDVEWIQLRASLRSLTDDSDSTDTVLGFVTRTFRWRSMRPGRYAMTITARDRVLHESVLDLQPGPQQWPVDGNALGLRGSVRSCAIVARSASAPSSFLDVTHLLVEAGRALPADWGERTDNSNSYYPTPQPSDLLLGASGHVPRRIANVRGDVDVMLAAMTTVTIENVLGDQATIHLRIVEDAVTDPVLRAFDTDNPHQSEMDVDRSIVAPSLHFAPGTALEVAVVRDGNVGPMQRVTVGTASPQRVTIR